MDVAEMDIDIAWNAMQMTDAYRRVNGPEAENLTPEGMLVTMMAAGYSEEAAQKAASDKARRKQEADFIAKAGG